VGRLTDMSLQSHLEGFLLPIPGTPLTFFMHTLLKNKNFMEVRVMARIGTVSWSWDPMREMERIERNWGNLLSGLGRPRVAKFPPVNILTSEDDVVITSEIPGINPDDIDLTVTGDTLTIKGSRPQLELKEGHTWQRRERSGGDFFRTIQLPFDVDSAHVEADYTKGILRVTLPRAESEKPKKISVKTA
jgi:HSP20 family protein